MKILAIRGRNLALRVPARLVVRMNLKPAFADAASWSG